MNGRRKGARRGPAAGLREPGSAPRREGPVGEAVFYDRAGREAARVPLRRGDGAGELVAGSTPVPFEAEFCVLLARGLPPRFLPLGAAAALPGHGETPGRHGVAGEVARAGQAASARDGGAGTCETCRKRVEKAERALAGLFEEGAIDGYVAALWAGCACRCSGVAEKEDQEARTRMLAALREAVEEEGLGRAGEGGVLH